MSAKTIIERLEASPLRAELGAVIDLELVLPSDVVADDYRIDPPGSEAFAMDGAGGVFHLLPDGRILLIDSEGSYGVVGSDFYDFIAIATGLESWRDALRFTGEPDIERAKRNWTDFVRRQGLDRALDEPWPYEAASYSEATPGAARRRIREQFDVASLPDPFAALHRNVNRSSGDVSVYWQGNPLFLFGRSP